MKTVKVTGRYYSCCEINNCNSNVQQVVEQHGGEMVTGWIVHRLGAINELVHHCVWRMPDGELRDVTPQISEVIGDQLLCELKQIEFLEDPEATFIDGTFARFSRFTPASRDVDVLLACEWLTLADQHFYKGNWDKGLYWNDKANKILHKLRVHCAPPDRRVVGKTVLQNG